ncbi:hypothetical protein MNBD_GAMMA05-2089 [hydrothermal vent metagenome]|uniref:Uncharacterized protein n=1 Tax=hydrothermal vent metagenome TaxID=652676 RepID=A0A3B0WGL8_9ZZZZ
MLKPLNNLLLVLLLLTVFGGQSVQAQTKVYQYDGKLPFVQMMLNMMVAMGILDRLPSNGAYGGYSSTSPWSRMSNPYSRAMAMQGLSSNPIASSAWGNPDWGVLPVESYTRNYSSNYDQPNYSSAWSSTDMDGWVNEPWDSSVWNAEPTKHAQNTPVQQAVPLVQNFNYNVPANNSNRVSQTPPRQNRPSRQQRSPLAKLAHPAAPVNRDNRQQNVPQPSQQKKPSPLRKQLKQKPCVTEFCGLKKPTLNGLWVAQNGEMLGVKNHRYLWSDSNSRYLTGQLKIQNEYLLANIDGYDNKLMRFKYKLARNHLLTMQPDGKTREFVRMSPDQYYGSRKYY